MDSCYVLDKFEVWLCENTVSNRLKTDGKQRENSWN